VTIAEVRRIYRQLRDRALNVTPAEAGYINGLWATWDTILAGFGDETTLPDWMEWYRGTLDGASDDTVIEWLDAFPSAVEERLKQSVPA